MAGGIQITRPPILWSVMAEIGLEETPAIRVVGKQVDVREGDQRAQDDLREHHAERHRRAKPEDDPCGGRWPGIQHQRPEQDTVHDHRPVHHPIEHRVEHGHEMHRRDQPEPEQPDKQDHRHHRLLHRIVEDQHQSALAEVAQPVRRPGQQCRSARAQRQQQGADMMHRHMLQPIGEEHALGQVFEAGLRHDPEQQAAHPRTQPGARTLAAGRRAGASSRVRTNSPIASRPGRSATRIRTGRPPASAPE